MVYNNCSSFRVDRGVRRADNGAMAAQDAWKSDFRRLYGVSQRIHPKNPRKYTSEATRWRMIVDGLEGVLASMPLSERRCYVIVAECSAYAKYRLESLKGEPEVQKTLFGVAG